MTLAWNKADLHIHTTYSDDATASVEDVLEYVANRTDLRVIAITDHDEIEGALKAQRLAKDYGIEVIVGEEVSTNEGHLLALFIEHFLAPGRPANRDDSRSPRTGRNLRGCPPLWLDGSITRLARTGRTMCRNQQRMAD